jgi:hypothetical protein
MNKGDGMTETCLAHILDPLAYEPNLPALMKRVRVKEGSAHAAELADLLEEALSLARPRAMYMVAYIHQRGDDFVDIEGCRFDSRVLRVNLDKAYRVFPYLATCGEELQIWADSKQDLVLNYWAEAIKEQVLYTAIRAAHEHLETHYQPGETASMSPGSLADWPIQQQQTLFQLFGAHSAAIGVRLTDSMLMLPTKSVSGIRFPSEDSFESCLLCPREGCPGRRAVYDPELYDQKFCQHAG